MLCLRQLSASVPLFRLRFPLCSGEKHLPVVSTFDPTPFLRGVEISAEVHRMTALSSCPRLAARLSGNATRLPLLVFAALAPIAQAQVQFPATAVGQNTPVRSVSVNVTGTVAKVEVLTMGTANLDYTESGVDNCVGVTSGNACNVPVVFAPKYPGARNGAVVLLDAGNNPAGVTYLTSLGLGPLPVMIPGAISIEAGQVGEWTQVNDNALATAADLYLPTAVAIDGAGDIFIADSHHNRIREVLAVAQGTLQPGDIVTVAGDGNAGYDNTANVATATSLNVPGGVAVDGAGNLYIADTNNNVVRKVDLTTGTITTVAGNGQPGYSGDSGLATSASLNSPQGITVDSTGDLYIADTGNNVIREVLAVAQGTLSPGDITTVVGSHPGTAGFGGDNGPATAALLDAPYGVALDAAGNMYIPDSGNNRIRKVDTTGKITTYAGNGTPAYLGDGGAAVSAELYSPLGVACDPAGNVFIADARNYVVRKVSTATGIISTIAGSSDISFYNDGKSDYTYGNGQSGEKFSGGGIAAGASPSIPGAGIYAPYGITVDAAGNLFIAEYFDHIIRKVSANTATLFFSPQYWQNQVSPPQMQKIENDGNAGLTFTAITPDTDAALGSGSCMTTGIVAADSQCTVAAEFKAGLTTTPPNPVVGSIDLTTSTFTTPWDVQLVGQELLQNQVNVQLTASPDPTVVYGSPISLTAAVTSCSGCTTHGTPTGTVTFYATPVGSTVSTTLGTPTVSSSGTATLQVSNLAVGAWTLTADYSGNTYYGAADSNPVNEKVEEQVIVSVVSSAPSSILGSSVSFTATVSITGGISPIGSVSFYDGGAYLGSAALNASGVALLSTASLPVGSDSITATYTDINTVTGTSTPITELVQQQTSTSLGSSANPSIHGSTVTFTAIVTASGTVAPTGVVTFYDSGTRIGTATLGAAVGLTASAVLNTASLAAGAHSITATYGGDTNDLGSTSLALAQTVKIATTTTALRASANPSIAGNRLTLTSSVTTNGGAASGSVNFYNGTILLGTATLNSSGVAVFSTSMLAVGSYSLTAAYQGNSDNSSSSSPAVAVSIVQATTRVQLASSSTAITVTNPVTLTATVSGNGGVPAGSVTFKDGANTLGSVALNAKGVAAFTTTSLAVGQHSITAAYTGDANDAGSTSAALAEQVAAFATQTMLAASATSLNTDQKLTLLTTTSSTSGQSVAGTITFMNGTTSLGSAPVSPAGTGSFTLNLQSGTYSITAQYSGDAVNAPSTSSAVSITVTQATEFTIQLSPNSVSIPTSKYANIGIKLASENGFSDRVALGCGSLPFSVTCNFASNDLTLSSGGAASVQLTVDTNSPLVSGSQAKNETPGSGILAACVFPGVACFGLLFWRFRKDAAILRVLVVIGMLAGTTFLMTGCGGFSLNSAKPGTYVIQVTATGEKTGITHVANLTVQVTQ